MSHTMSFSHSLQIFNLRGVKTPRLKLYYQLKSTFAISLSPTIILKYSFLSKLSLTFVNPLEVLCSDTTP